MFSVPRSRLLYILITLGAAFVAGIFLYAEWRGAMSEIERVSARIAEQSPPWRAKPSHRVVKALYLTAYSAGSPKKLNEIIALIDRTELNAVVIDIKDYSGFVLYDSDVPFVDELGFEKVQMRDVRGVLQTLHDHGIFAIARQTVFQDPVLAERKSEWAIKMKDGRLWRDYKGLSWVDPTRQEVWDYNMAIAKEAIRLGFDEINFDYVRFPSDGNLSSVAFVTNGRAKHEVMRDFFRFVGETLGQRRAWISIDVFGLTMERGGADDLNIGQRIEDATDAVDYIAPMMYPSHYPARYLGFLNPAEHPGEVVAHGMELGLPKFVGARARVRPWLQAFSLGAVYDAAKIRAQIDAVEAVSPDGWMLWNAANRYTDAGLKMEGSHTPSRSP